VREPYSIVVDSDDGTTTIRLGGEIDVAAARGVRVAVADSILDNPPPRCLVIDLRDTTFLGSTGINALVLARSAAGFVRATLRVTPGPANVMRVIELCGLQHVLNVRQEPEPLISTG
jgi:anti-anti-sigma factor